MLKRVCLSVMAAATVSIGTISLSYADRDVEYVNKPDAYTYPSILKGKYYVGLTSGLRSTFRTRYADPGYVTADADVNTGKYARTKPGIGILVGFRNNYRYAIEMSYLEHEGIDYTGKTFVMDYSTNNEVLTNVIFSDRFHELDIAINHYQPIYGSTFSWAHRVGIGHIWTKTAKTKSFLTGSPGVEYTGGGRVTGLNFTYATGPEYTYNMANGDSLSARLAARWSSSTIAALAEADATFIMYLPSFRLSLMYEFA